MKKQKPTALVVEQLIKDIQTSPEMKGMEAYRGATLSVVDRREHGSISTSNDAKSV